MTRFPAHPALPIERRKSDSHLIYSTQAEPPVTCDVDATGIITAIHGGEQPARPWPDDFSTPGLVDIQVNGFAGVDFNAPGLTAERMDYALGQIAASGVTCVLPTLITALEAPLLAQLAELDKAVSDSVLGPLMVPGYHIEGPFLSPKDGYSGAHSGARMIPGSRDLVRRLESVSSRPLRIMTLAPEQPGVIDLIPFLTGRGIACAIGHSAASRSQIDAAVSAGATLSTHLGNGLPHQLNKNENPLFTQLGRDELTASFIADGIHVHPESLQSYLRAKTLARSIIVTDAVSAAGPNLGPGLYSIGDLEIERRADGRVQIPGSTYLAGSSATMDQMVRNLMAWFGYSMSDILVMARTNPARLLPGIADAPTVGAAVGLVRWALRDGVVAVRETHIGPWIVRPEPVS